MNQETIRTIEATKHFLIEALNHAEKEHQNASKSYILAAIYELNRFMNNNEKYFSKREKKRKQKLINKRKI